MSNLSRISSQDQPLLVQQLSIHQLDIRKVWHDFSHSIPGNNPDLFDLIERIVITFNSTKEHNPYQPIVEHAEMPPFQLKAYAQISEITSGLAKWVDELEGTLDLTTRRIDYLFFFYRQFEHVDKTIKNEIFALSSGQAYRVIHAYSDFHFPIQLARRLFSPKLISSRNRPLVGRVLIYSEILKESATVSETDALDKLFTRMKFNLRPDASLFHIPCFQNKKGKALRRGLSAEFGLGMIRLSKRVSPEDYVQILNHFSRISRGEKTLRFSKKKEKIEEVDSEDFDFLQYVHPVDFSRVTHLNNALKRLIYQTVVENEDLPALDFCHKRLSDYFHAEDYKLRYPGLSKPFNCSRPFSAAYMVNLLKKVPFLKNAQSEEEFFSRLDSVFVSFKSQGKKEEGPFFDFLEGEVHVKESYYWRLHTMWYQVQADYLSLIDQEFREILQMTLIEESNPAALPFKWLSPQEKAVRKQEVAETHRKSCPQGKKCTHKSKYDAEAEYNQRYLSQDNYLLGDKICPRGIELYDILHWNRKYAYLYHVKEGFGQKTRDACSQIYQSARQLHTSKHKSSSHILHEFYEEATSSTVKGSYRKIVRKKMRSLKEDKFRQIFKKTLVFVYAFADDAQECRLLSHEKGGKTGITTVDDIEMAHGNKFVTKGKALFEALVQEKYLTPKGFLTAKFFNTPQAKFALPSLKVKAQLKSLHQCLSNSRTQFNSTIAKLEVLRVKQEVEKLGFKFLICQIPRTDYPDEEPSSVSESEEEVSDHKEEMSASSESEEETSDVETTDSSAVSESEEETSSIEATLTQPAEISDFSESDDEDPMGGLKEGDTFSHNEETFNICPTPKDGACLLHAILGTKIRGRYTYGGRSASKAVRKVFVEALQKRVEEIEDAYKKCLVQLLQDYLGPSPSSYTRQIFNSLPNHIQFLREQLAKIESGKQSLIEAQQGLFSILSQTEDAQLKTDLETVFKIPSLSSLQNDPSNRNRLFRNHLPNIITFTQGTPRGIELSENYQSLKESEQGRDQVLEEWVMQQEVFDRYLKVCSDLSYYFSDAEVELASHLFDKRIRLFGHKAADQVYDSRDFGDETNETIVIFHKGIHYSRCEEDQ